MLTYKDAKEHILEYINKSKGIKDIKIVLYEPGIEIEYGWVFDYDQEVVFHPKVEELYSKIKKIKREVKDDNQISKLLTEQERILELESVGLVGKTPIFIDKITKEIKRIHYPIEAIIQEVRASKSDFTFRWEITFKDNSNIKLEKIKEFYNNMALYDFMWFI